MAELLDRIGWAPLGGYIAGVGLLIAALLSGDTAFLWAGVFVVLVSLAIGRLKELIAGPDSIRALFFPQIAKEVAEEAAKPELPAPPRRDPQTMERTTSDGVTQKDEVTATVTKGGQAQATIVRPEDIANAKEPSELVRRLFNYWRRIEGMVGPANVQYGDFQGTVSLDGHGGPTDAGVLEAAGLNTTEWAPVGFEVGRIQSHEYGRVYAVPLADLKDVDGLPGLAARDGAIKAERFDMLPGKRRSSCAASSAGRRSRLTRGSPSERRPRSDHREHPVLRRQPSTC